MFLCLSVTRAYIGIAVLKVGGAVYFVSYCNGFCCQYVVDDDDEFVLLLFCVICLCFCWFFGVGVGLCGVVLFDLFFLSWCLCFYG